MTRPRIITSIRSAFSLIEVMVALCILTIISAALASSIATQHKVMEMERETRVVQGLARTLRERFLGADWKNLNSLNAGWSWVRRATPRSTSDSFWKTQRNSPMMEAALKTYGLLPTSSSVKDLSVYVEYYQSALITSYLSSSSDTATLWRNATGSPKDVQKLTDLSRATTYAPSVSTYVYPPTPASGLTSDAYPDTAGQFNFDSVQDAIIIRILICWTPLGSSSDTTWYETQVVRKK